jgi:outer membrane protein assembly factor BamB
MKISDLVFVGIKGSVVALYRATGEQAWVTWLKGSDFVNVVFHDGTLLAVSSGEVFCLDPLRGQVFWHNPLKGFGRGLATIAAEGLLQSDIPPVMAEKRRRDQQAAASSAAAAG